MILWKNSLINIKKNLISFFSLFFMMFMSSAIFSIISNFISQVETQFNYVNKVGNMEQMYFGNYTQYSIKDPITGNYLDMGKMDSDKLNSILDSDKYHTDEKNNYYGYEWDAKDLLTVLYGTQLYDFRTTTKYVDKVLPKITDADLDSPLADGSEEHPYYMSVLHNYAKLNNYKIGTILDIGRVYFQIQSYCVLPEYPSTIIAGNPFQNYDSSSYCLVSHTTLSKIITQMTAEFSSLNKEIDFKFNNITRGDSKRFLADYNAIKRIFYNNTHLNADPKIHADLVKSWYSKLAIQKVVSTISSAKVILGFFIFGVYSICVFSLIVTSKKLIQDNLVQIGILKASGYGKGELLFNYSIFAIFCGFSAGLLGTLIGFSMQFLMNNMVWKQLSFQLSDVYFDYMIFITSLFLPIVIMGLTSLIYNSFYINKNPLDLIKKLNINKKVHPIVNWTTLKIAPLPFASKFLILNLIRSAGKIVIIFVSVLFSSFLMMFAIVSNGAIHNSVNREYSGLKYNFFIDYDNASVNKKNSDLKIRNYDLSHEFNILNQKWSKDASGKKIAVSGYYNDTYYYDTNEGMGYFFDDKWLDDFRKISLQEKIDVIDNMYETHLNGYYLLNEDMPNGYNATNVDSLIAIRDDISLLPLQQQTKDYIIKKLDIIILDFNKHTEIKQALTINIGFTTYDLAGPNTYGYFSRKNTWSFTNSRIPKDNTAYINVFDPQSQNNINNFLSDMTSTDINYLNDWSLEPNILPIFVNYSMAHRNNLQIHDKIMFDNKLCEIIGIKRDYSDNQIMTSKEQYEKYFTDNNSIFSNVYLSKSNDINAMNEYLNNNLSLIIENNHQGTNIIKSPINRMFNKNSVLESLNQVLEASSFILALVIFISVTLSLSLIFSITNLVLIENKKQIMIMQTIGYRTWEINFLFSGIYLIAIIISAVCSIPLTELILNLFGNSLSNAMSICLDFQPTYQNLILNFFIMIIILGISVIFGSRIIKKDKISQILKSFEI